MKKKSFAACGLNSFTAIFIRTSCLCHKTSTLFANRAKGVEKLLKKIEALGYSVTIQEAPIRGSTEYTVYEIQ